MRSPPSLAARLAAALALAAGLSACGGDERDIEVGTVELRSVAEVVEAPGAVVARTNLELRAPAGGTVDTLLVDSGDAVAKGDVLLTLSSPAAEDALAAAESAAAQAQDAEPAEALPPSGAVADSDAARAAEGAFDDAEAAARQLPDGPGRDAALAQAASARAAFAAAQAQAQDAIDRFQAGLGSLTDALGSLSAVSRVQAEAAVAAARRTVEALTIRAPAPGVVTLGTGAGGTDASSLLDGLPPEIAGQASGLLGGGGGGAAAPAGGPLSVGTPVQGGGLLATVIDDAELTLRAEVDETDVLAVSEGIPAEVELDAVPGALYPATVSSVDLAPAASARGGVAYAVTLTLSDGEGADGRAAPRPRPGMSAVVSLQVAQVTGAASVPVSAIVRDGARDTVWIVDDGRAARREVRLGAEGEEFVEVLDGLAAGDRVVVRGADVVEEGDEIA